MNSIKFYHNGTVFKPNINRNVYLLQYPCSSKSVCSRIESTLPSGTYIVEVWGAQGGTLGNYEGGRGGYSRGVLTLRNEVKAYFYIGAQGTSIGPGPQFTESSFNGGGIGKSDHRTYSATGGGGGTDIRLVEDSIYHRLIVAGGGGGSSNGYNGCIGGSGGGLVGTVGSLCHSDATRGGAGTQTEGGSAGGHGTGGSFWSGGNKTTWDGCGGGGGWFGGGDGWGYLTSGSGGSGFIFNSSNYENAIKANLQLQPKFFLDDGYMITGNNPMPSPFDYTIKTGHYGNGAISITFINMFHNCKAYCTMSVFPLTSCVFYLISLLTY
jgi:hypothetical protein